MNCQLPNICLGRTIKDLTDEVSKVTDIKVASSTQTVSTNIEVATRRVSNTRVSLNAAEEPSTERTCSCKTTRDSNTTLYTSMPISTVKGLTFVAHICRTSQAPTETYEVSKTSAVSALKSTPALIKSKGNIHIYPQSALSVI